MNDYSVRHVFSFYIYTEEADDSPPPRAEVKNTLSYTSHHPCDFKKSYVKKKRGNLVLIKYR